MSAIEGQWPTATVIAFLGPWVSDADTADHFDDVFEFNDVAWANELIGPFFLGMASAVDGSDVTLVDGGEVYSLRSDRDFEHAYDWMKGGVAADHDLLPAQVRDRYGEAVSVGFGVYDRSPRGTPVEPEEWRDKLTNALEAADHYVWAYTEAYDWWGKGWPEEPVPEEVIRATAGRPVHRGPMTGRRAGRRGGCEGAAALHRPAPLAFWSEARRSDGLSRRDKGVVGDSGDRTVDER